jgi:CubicO group peptidase (beta-lactamase class C family)
MTSSYTRALLFGALLWAAPALTAQPLPVALPEDVGMSASRLERLDDALQAYVDEGRLPGGVALVLRRGSVVYRNAFGHRDREAGDAMEVTDRFRIASQTKALVSVAIMMLQEEGRLLIGDPVGRYLPAYARTTVAVEDEGGGYQVVEARRAVTLRDLLTHTAGVDYGGGAAAAEWEEAGVQGWYFAHRSEPVRATVDRIAGLPFRRHPGEAFVYGYATDILGAVVEAVSGLSLDAFLRSRILEPLEMDATSFYVPPEARDELATVYNLRRGEALSRAPDGPGMQTQGEYVDGPRRSFSGGAGLVSTAGDYARFLQMLLNGGTLNGRRILSPKTVELMIANHVGDLFPGPGVGFGLGFSVVEDLGARGVPGSVGEFGWGGAYHSTYWVDPLEELVVVYLTQVIPAAGLDDHGRLRALVYQAILEGS